GAFEQCWKTAVDIVADTLVAVYEMRQESSEATRRRPEVDDVQTAAGTQDAMDLGEARELVLARQVMEHERRDGAIKRIVGVRQLGGEPLIELDRGSGCRHLAARQTEHLRITIEANHLGVGMQLSDQNRQRGGAATEIQHAMTGCDGGLLNEPA